MDIDKNLISAILREGQPGLKSVLDLGIHSDILAGEGKAAFKYIIEYSKKHGVIPDIQTLALGSQVALQLDGPGVAAHWAELIQNRRISRAIEETFIGLEPLVQEKPREALSMLETMLLKLRRERLAGTLIESLPALGPEVIAYYEKIKAGDRGILTPWETINEATLGLWPEDLALFVARLGIGKTWTSIMIAGTAWEQKIRDPDGTLRPVKVLYATTEMAKMRIALRWYSLKLKLPYGAFRRGQLGAFLEKKFYDGVKELVDSPNFNIVGGDFDFSMESFDAAIDEAKPDIVVLDGAYLLKVQGINRTEKAANAFDELKRINKRRKVPIVVTMQFNREVKTNSPKSVQAENIALSDVAGWNADLIYGLIQTEEMKKSRRMMLKPLKIREGTSEEIECNWDFDTMNFSELPKAVGYSSSGTPGSGPAAGDAAEDPFSPNSGGAPTGGDDTPF